MSDKNNNNNMSDNPDFQIIKAFLDGCESQNRSNLSVINSLCYELKNLKIDDDESFSFMNSCAEGILLQCTQMMKMTEIYYILYDSLNQKSLINENVELCEYLEAFTLESNKQIGYLLAVELKKSTPVYINIIKRLFDFIFAIFMRRAAVTGAVRMEIGYNEIKNGAEITMTVLERDDKAIVGLAENFSTNYADDIIRIAVEKMNSQAEISNDSLKLIIQNKKNGKITMNSSDANSTNTNFPVLASFFSDLGSLENDNDL